MSAETIAATSAETKAAGDGELPPSPHTHPKPNGYAVTSNFHMSRPVLPDNQVGGIQGLWPGAPGAVLE